MGSTGWDGERRVSFCRKIKIKKPRVTWSSQGLFGRAQMTTDNKEQQSIISPIYQAIRSNVSYIYLTFVHDERVSKSGVASRVGGVERGVGTHRPVCCVSVAAAGGSMCLGPRLSPAWLAPHVCFCCHLPAVFTFVRGSPNPKNALSNLAVVEFKPLQDTVEEFNCETVTFQMNVSPDLFHIFIFFRGA